MSMFAADRAGTGARFWSSAGQRQYEAARLEKQNHEDRLRGRVARVHFECAFIVIHPLFLFGGLFCLLCRGFLRRHVYITPFPLRLQD
jgi:hypothetical protein